MWIALALATRRVDRARRALLPDCELRPVTLSPNLGSCALVCAQAFPLKYEGFSAVWLGADEPKVAEFLSVNPAMVSVASLCAERRQEF